jgi:hypothetical protein
MKLTQRQLYKNLNDIMAPICKIFVMVQDLKKGKEIKNYTSKYRRKNNELNKI